MSTGNKRAASFMRQYGEVTVNAKPTIFKKIRLRTHENIGSGPIHLPEEELHTSAYWFSFERGSGGRRHGQRPAVRAARHGQRARAHRAALSDVRSAAISASSRRSKRCTRSGRRSIFMTGIPAASGFASGCSNCTDGCSNRRRSVIRSLRLHERLSGLRRADRGSRLARQKLALDLLARMGEERSWAI